MGATDRAFAVRPRAVLQRDGGTPKVLGVLETTNRL